MVLKLITGLLIVGSISCFAIDGKSYNDDLKRYVLKRLESRTVNGSKEPGLTEMVSKDAKVALAVDAKSLNCIGYESPNANGKAVGVCLIKAFDKASGGDHLEIMYTIIISADIEHENVSRSWRVTPQQYLYL